MFSDEVFAMAQLVHLAHPVHAVHGGKDENHFGVGGIDVVNGPDLSAAGADLHAAVAGHYQALIEGPIAAITPHVVMVVLPPHSPSAPGTHFHQRTVPSNHRDDHH
jgi:hypothetical protein